MTFKLHFTRDDLAVFLAAEIRMAGERAAHMPLLNRAGDRGRAAGEKREEARILKEAGVAAPVLARALSGEGVIISEAQTRLWLAIGINPEIRRDTRELQAFDAIRRVAHEGKVAA